MPQMTFDLEDGHPPVSFPINQESCARFAEFMRECEAGKKDAERYRWLRYGDNDELVIKQLHDGINTPYLPRNEALDATIDAAMQLPDNAL